MKKRSYSGLVADLRSANDEAQGYLDSLVIMRRDADDLRKEVARWKEAGQGADRLCSVLIRALEFYQKAGGMK